MSKIVAILKVGKHYIFETFLPELMLAREAADKPTFDPGNIKQFSGWLISKRSVVYFNPFYC